MTPPSTVAIIGCGRWGSTVARKLESLPMFRVDRVYDANPENAERLTNEIRHAMVCNSIKDVCKHVDRVVIATPPNSDRVLQVAQVLDSGIKRIRLEKPFAASIDDADTMREMESAANAAISVGHTTVWQPLIPALVSAIKKLIARRELKSLDFYRLCDRGPAHASSVVFDLMSHDFAIHRALFPALWRDEPPKVVEAIANGDGRVDVLLDSGATFAASHSHPSTIRGVSINKEHMYDEANQILKIGGLHFAGSTRDPLKIELEQWWRNTYYGTKAAAQIVNVCEQAQNILVNNSIGAKHAMG